MQAYFRIILSGYVVIYESIVHNEQPAIFFQYLVGYFASLSQSLLAWGGYDIEIAALGA